MFIDRMIGQDQAPVLERMIEFTAARHKLIAENIVNASTPGYRQRDLSVETFQRELGRLVEARRSGRSVEMTGPTAWGRIEHPQRGILFHDGNNRSMEQLMSDQARNAMMHNLAVELLRKQFEQLRTALRERIG